MRSNAKGRTVDLRSESDPLPTPKSPGTLIVIYIHTVNRVLRPEMMDYGLFTKSQTCWSNLIEKIQD